jgi:glutaredoxin
MYTTPKRCPKCRYERQATDTTPDWQCPSCGIAYSKAEGGEGPAAGNVRVYAADTQSSGGGGKWIVAGLVVLAIALFGLRAMRGGEEAAPIVPTVAVASSEQPLVIMYATSWCPYCQRAREFFARHKIVYVEYDVERDQEASRAHRNLGGRGVPLITVGDEVISGFSEEQLSELLEPWMK